MKLDGAEFIQQTTGSRPVFPGHPLVVACTIMALYRSYAQASRSNASNVAAALSDMRIPGTGDHVVAGLEVLAIGRKGGTVDDMVAFANDYWTRGGAGGYAKYVGAGEAQARLLEEWFRERAAAWVALPRPR